ncbi:KEOPS complex subunit Pcc1 [Pyrobaculum aerophilum]|uniref:KEOPS complex subunit Pcc1 n=1 Tax=Pyrobaculum aerophilum TaxID=13773 RepID=UPI002FDB4BD7
MRELRSKIETPFDCKYINAVKPDDVDLPEGMEIVHQCVEGRWQIHITYKIKRPEDLLTLKNTIDEIIRALQVIERSIPQ